MIQLLVSIFPLSLDPHHTYATARQNNNEGEIDGVCIDGNDSDNEFVSDPTIGNN